MPASIDDLLTTQKNGVVAINGLNQTLKLIEADLPCICTNLAAIVTQLELLVINSNLAVPSLMSLTVAPSTTHLQVVGTGRLFAVSIPTHSGSGQVYVYDSATAGGIAASNLIFTCLAANTSGWQTYYDVNLAYTQGIVIKTDANMSCAVSYTPTP